MPHVEVRTAAAADAETMFAVIAARDVADLGFVDYALEDVHSDLERDDVDVWVAELDGEIVGTAVVDHLGSQMCVHPQAEGKGVGTALRETIEAAMRGRAQPLLRQAVAGTNAAAQRALAGAGYACGHVYLTLRADLAAPQAAPRSGEAPVRPLRRPEEDREAHRIIETAFTEIEGNVEMPFEAWRADLLDRPDARHPVAIVVEDGDGLAGVLIGRAREDVGFVDVLGIEKRARGRGYGRALLLAAFEHYRQAGFEAVELSVHGRNATAQGLYSSVGLREERRAERWEKTA